MKALQFAFKQEQAIEAVLYIAKRIPDPTLHSISKLLYFADKLSLEHYGRLICGDHYVAMQYGPVPSNTYELMKEVRAGTSSAPFVVRGMAIVPKREADIDLLSESDTECLNETIARYAKSGFDKRTRDSHDEAWQKAWNERGSGNSQPIPVEDIARQFDDAEPLIEHLLHRHD